MAKRPALGRGLAALLGETSENEVLAEGPTEGAVSTAAPAEAVAADSAGGVVELSVSAVRPNPLQPRRVFDPEALQELATSIESVGVVQPIIVRKVDEAYELIAGERRWRAAQMAGFTVVPAIVREASDVESLELALIENVVRQQLNPVDEAFALKVLLEDLGVTQESLAARVGRSRSAIANKIRLLDLPSAIQESLAAGALTEGHGRALLGVGERGGQLRLARRVMDKGLSVRQVEDEVRRLNAKPGDGEKKAAAQQIPPEMIDETREIVLQSLGVMPRVKSRGAGGVVEIPFASVEALQQILKRLNR